MGTRRTRNRKNGTRVRKFRKLKRVKTKNKKDNQVKIRKWKNRERKNKERKETKRKLLKYRIKEANLQGLFVETPSSMTLVLRFYMFWLLFITYYNFHFRMQLLLWTLRKTKSRTSKSSRLGLLIRIKQLVISLARKGSLKMLQNIYFKHCVQI